MLEPITNQDLLSVIEKARKSLGSTPTETSSQTKEQSGFLKAHGLDNVDCPICGNVGQIYWKDEDGITIHYKDCECMKRRVSLRNISNSKMEDDVRTCNFNNFQTPDDDTKRVKQKALTFVNSDARGFLIAGQSGSGKTHLCSAICGAFLKKDIEAVKFKWREHGTELKTMITDSEEYRQRINKLNNVPVLYIDDFWKGTISDADINLAFTIINGRYTRKRPIYKTIISTELMPKELVEVDEAIGGRILELAKGFVIQAPKTNWRIK